MSFWWKFKNLLKRDENFLFQFGGWGTIGLDSTTDLLGVSL